MSHARPISTNSPASTTKPPGGDADDRPGDELADLRADLGLGELDLVADQQRRVLGDLRDRRRDVRRRLFRLGGHQRRASEQERGQHPAGERGADEHLGPGPQELGGPGRRQRRPARADVLLRRGPVRRGGVAEVDAHSGGSSSKMRRHRTRGGAARDDREERAEPRQETRPDQALDEIPFHQRQSIRSAAGTTAPAGPVHCGQR